jgi:hypothetical protein
MVLANDVEGFRDLMEEAADTTPKGPLDNPKKTVLTHFLDLAEDPRFFPYIDEWRAQGWVAEDMLCSIHRAHARENWETNREAAWRSVEMCMATAREASKNAEKSWQVADCLEEAHFLTQTSTLSLVPFVERVADPLEPLKFRVALLDGMTRIPVSGPDRRQMHDAKLSRAEAVAQAEAQLSSVEARYEWIVTAVKPMLEAGILASGTAVGAMEIEEASVALGRSYVGKYALSESPGDVDLAWAWIRTMKNKKKNNTLLSLGIWDRNKETKEDMYWYFCVRPAETKSAAASPLGPMNLLDAISIRAKERAPDPEILRSKHCVGPKTGEYQKIWGPFPLESIGRSTIIGAAKSESTARPAVVLKKRVLL